MSGSWVGRRPIALPYCSIRGITSAPADSFFDVDLISSCPPGFHLLLIATTPATDFFPVSAVFAARFPPAILSPLQLSRPARVTLLDVPFLAVRTACLLHSTRPFRCPLLWVVVYDFPFFYLFGEDGISFNSFISRYAHLQPTFLFPAFPIGYGALLFPIRFLSLFVLVVPFFFRLAYPQDSAHLICFFAFALFFSRVFCT